MQYNYTYFASCPRNTEDLLKQELLKLGAVEAKEAPGGVHFNGPLRLGYKACLYSRIANRILLEISTFPCTDESSLYEGGIEIPWENHINPHKTIAVTASSTGEVFKNDSYLALKLKDALVDRLRNKTGTRPSVNTENPDLLISLHIHGGIAAVSLDLSGPSLFKRGYRQHQGQAPLKENVAAAALLRLGWEDLAKKGAPLLDPFCGSGTILIEAALIAAGIPPLFLRSKFGFMNWVNHAEDLWQALLRDAESLKREGLNKLPDLYGFDIDKRAVLSAEQNLRAAFLSRKVRIINSSFKDAARHLGSNITTGLICTNPPYGERLGDKESLKKLYSDLGYTLLKDFKGWRAGIITGDKDLSLSIPLRAVKINTLYNGSLECTLAQFQVEKEYEFRHYPTPKPVDESFSKTEGAKMFQNRLNKNRARYSREAKEQGVSCYRLYDSDMPEYAFAIDLYEDTWMVVQEYDPPVTIDPEKAEFRRKEVLAVLQQESGFSKENIFIKTRSKQKGKTQYQPSNSEGELHRIRESSFTFYANFNDYLDTGIFLDHRITRNLLKGLAKGRRFLNLFCYTATATVYAVSGGAVSSVSVDSSQTYLAWAEKNFRANGIKDPEHTLVRSDVIPWLSREKGKYDLVFVDPPTFSNSKSRPKYLSIQQDHEGMLLQIARILSPSGIIIFSTHYRKFKMNVQVLEEIFNLENMTDQTIPFDFQRNRRIHQVWKLTLKTNRIKRGINDEDKEEYRTAKTGGTYRRREHSTDNHRRTAGGGGKIRNSLGKKDLRRLD